MNPDIKQKWLDALRSGEYQQGEKVLRTADNKFCCLGVLTDIAIKEGVGNLTWNEKKPLGWLVKNTEDDEATKVLPPEVSEWAGLDSDNPSVQHDELNRECVIAHLNDTGIPFDEIAGIIEEQL
jgi:hypothetical protein